MSRFQFGFEEKKKKDFNNDNIVEDKTCMTLVKESQHVQKLFVKIK